MSRVGLFQPRILKDRRERRTTAVRERIRPALAIVRDESPDGRGLHRMVDDADRAVANAGRNAEQNHAVLCAEFLSSAFPSSLPPPALGGSGYRSLIAYSRVGLPLAAVPSCAKGT